MCCAYSCHCSITALNELARELDEGLGSHVEEFARELTCEAGSGDMDDCPSPSGGLRGEDDEDELCGEEEDEEQHEDGST